MAQLAEAVSAVEKLWRVDSIPSQRFLRVESELVEVTTRYPMKSLIRVRRAQEGTTAASHADETELTPVYLAISDQAGGEQVVLSRIVTLTDAQIKALPSTPIEIIPAPGAGLLILPVMAVLIFDRTDDYTNIDAGCGITFQLGAVGPLSVVDEASGDVSDLLAAGSDSMVTTIPYQRVGGQYTGAPSGDPPQVNQPLTLRALNGAAGNFTGGNAANSLRVTVWYGIDG